MMIDLTENSRFAQYFGRLLILATIASFIFVGFIINLLQLILLTTVLLSGHNKRVRELQIKINGYLIYILFAPPTFILYYWSGIQINLYLKDSQLLKDAQAKLFAVLIPNHTYELDYMICFALADQFGNIGSYKSYSKDELKYIPVLGWGLWMSDIIFVKRSWQKDKNGLSRKLDRLFDYDQSILALFSEGTRWTPEKHTLSIEFAKSSGIKPYKHHLVPRARGFNYTIKHCWRQMILSKQIDEKPFRLFNLQFIMPDKPNFKDFIQGKQIRADIYCEEVKLDEEIRKEVLESRDEEDCPKLTQLLRDIYRRKDELVDEYYANDCKFSIESKDTQGIVQKYPKSFKILITWLIGSMLTYSSLIYLATSTYLKGSVYFWTLLIGFISSSFWFMSKVEFESSANNRLLMESRSQSIRLKNLMNGAKIKGDGLNEDENIKSKAFAQQANSKQESIGSKYNQTDKEDSPAY